MSAWLLRLHRAQRGVSLVELLVALAVFAMFVLMIDAVFSSARTNARKTEVAADVQQNARVAVDRIVRELRETNVNQVLCDVVSTCTGSNNQIVFRSARLTADNSVFCLYTRTAAGLGYDARCLTGSGSFSPTLPTPPSTASPCNTTTIPCNTYTPTWQRSVGYYLSGNSLQRVYGPLTQPNAALPSLPLTGGDTIATMIQSFSISLSGGAFSVTLQALGNPQVQGQAIPAQQIQLPGQAMSRN